MGKPKIAPAIFIALIVAMAVACGGGTTDVTSGAESPVAERSGDASGPLLLNAGDLLTESGARFDSHVASMRMEMDFTFSAGDAEYTSTVQMWAKEPNDLYMTVDVPESAIGNDLGDSFDMLLVDNKLYMTDIVFGGNWPLFMEFEDQESPGQTFADSMLLDYAALSEAFGTDVEDLGQDILDGDIFRHFQVTVDLPDCIEALSDSVVQPEVLGNQLPSSDEIWGGRVFKPMVIDVWVHPNSYLPHRIETDWQFEAGGERAGFKMSIRIFDYNAEFDLPDPPENVRSFETAMEQWLADLEPWETDPNTLGDSAPSSLELASGLIIRDVNGDSRITGLGGDTATVTVNVAPGSTLMLIGDPDDPLVAKVSDAEDRFTTTEVAITEVAGDGDLFMEEGESFELTIALPDGLVLTVNEPFSLELIPPGPVTGSLIIHEMMPAEVSPEIVLAP